MLYKILNEKLNFVSILMNLFFWIIEICNFFENNFDYDIKRRIIFFNLNVIMY